MVWVRPGVVEVRQIFCLASTLIKLDLPTFERPTQIRTLSESLRRSLVGSTKAPMKVARKGGMATVNQGFRVVARGNDLGRAKEKPSLRKRAGEGSQGEEFPDEREEGGFDVGGEDGEDADRGRSGSVLNENEALAGVIEQKLACESDADLGGRGFHSEEDAFSIEGFSEGCIDAPDETAAGWIDRAAKERDVGAYAQRRERPNGGSGRRGKGDANGSMSDFHGSFLCADRMTEVIRINTMPPCVAIAKGVKWGS